MSVRVMNAVFERYLNGGGEMVLALALADHAHDDGRHIFPSVLTLAAKTRQSERTVQYQLRRMEESGWLQLVAHEGGGRGKAREYRIDPIWLTGERVQELHPSAPLLSRERVQSPAQRVQPDVVKGATAIAPEPSGTINEANVVPPTVKGKGQRTIPPDFAITPELRKWAESKGWAPYIDAHLEYFLDYASNGRKAINWEATFRNAVRSDWGNVRSQMVRAGVKPARGRAAEVAATKCAWEAEGERCTDDGCVALGDGRMSCAAHYRPFTALLRQRKQGEARP